MTVHDCFLFFNELDALEIRLEELDPVVDRFVLVEATTTFSGQPKPLVFAGNQARFERFLPRIEHVVVEDLPGADAWAREAFQRNAILRGLAGAAPDDVVLISDVDEVPRADAVRRFLREDMQAAALVLRFYYYRLNCQNTRGTPASPWSVIVRRRLLGAPQDARASKHSLPHLLDAGWHFSCLGDERAIREKIQAFSHQELNLPRFTDEAEIRRRIRRGLDLFDRPGFLWRFVPLDDSFPRHVLAHQDRFRHLIGAAEPATTGEARLDPPRQRRERPRLLLLYHRDPTTTAAYLEAALRQVADVTTAGEGQEVHLDPRAHVFLPELLSRLGRDFDAVLEVQGNSVEVSGQDQAGVPCAWWAIDTHLYYMNYCHHFFRARAFDHVFVAQKQHVHRYQEWAWTAASWLPLAADPAVFRPFPLEQTADVGFVGSVRAGLHEARRDLLGRLNRRFPRLSFARGLWREDAARFMSSCRLVFNRSLHEDVNMRVFEAASCARPLLTDRLPRDCGLEELFEDGRHLLLYDDRDLEAVVERWLADPASAEQVGAAAREHVLAHHTYAHRAAEVLRVLGLGRAAEEALPALTAEVAG